MNFIYQHWDAAKLSISQILKNPYSGFLNIFVFSLAIALPLMLYVFIDNITRYNVDLSTSTTLSVFLNPAIKAEQLSKIKAILKKSQQVHKVEFISKQEGLKKLEKREDFGELLLEIEGNPLPDMFFITPVSSNPEILKKLEKNIKSYDGVDSVELDSEWVNKLSIVVKLTKTLAFVLTLLLGFAVITIMINTIRLQVLLQREEIKFSKLIGATDTYIRRPFLYFGAIQGFLGATIAMIFSAGFIALVNKSLKQLGQFYNTGLSMQKPDDGYLWLVIGISMILGLAGAWFSTNEHLRQHNYR
tara:strand:- start:575 stop:1480 length:906 start_codon:yes stop_codon:yes gene_type:complete